MRSTRLASSGKGPRLQGSFRSPCFCFSVATNPSILLFARYFRFSSEQYPLSVRTSSGLCPDCSWIASISGTTCCLSLVACVTVCPTINWKSGSTATCVLYPCTNPSDPFMMRDSGSVKLYWAFGSGCASLRSLPALPAVSFILFFIRGLCLLQQLLHFLPQPLLGLLHPSITHGLVLARVGFYFAPIQSHSSQLQRSHL